MTFLPRTLVHLFYLESSFHQDTAPGETVQVDLRRNLDTTDPRHWRLLFWGEVRGYSLSKAGGSRTVTLSCQDGSSYWEQAKIGTLPLTGQTLH